jgi:hypothetical protein
MPTSTKSSDPVENRQPLRLSMSAKPGRDVLDGGWWPQSRDLAVELPDLMAHFPPGHGRVIRAVYSPPDWDGYQRRVPLADGYVKVGSFPKDDTHVIDLLMSGSKRLRLLVVPSSAEDGDAAVTAAATVGNTRSPADLLGIA